MSSSDAVTRLNAALEGRYRIEHGVGEGGMATVYLARDERHNRSVALKVLKAELAAIVGAERFLAEIETTARLQHPHILPLFDSGEADGFLFYVMPYVEGESLRQRLDRQHQLPVDEAVRIAENIAEALNYAHAEGVIHRDVKPANVLLQAGKPVLSDFGVALAVSASGAGRLTETGLSLGTPHYMSPEQATGDLSVGGATDVYALGCVLHEMLVGEPPFTGSTPQAILGKIVAGRLTPVTEQRGTVPKHVAAVVAKALEKVAADRFASAGDMARALGDESFRWPRDTERSPQVVWKAAFAAALALAVISSAVALARRPGAEELPGDPPVAMSFFLPEGQLLDHTFPPPTASMDLSPDGTRLVYVGDEGGTRRLYVRETGRFGVRPLEGTEGGTGPFFSPDGQSVGFFLDDALYRIPVDGGLASRIAPVPVLPEGASWGDDGTIVFALNAFSAESGFWRVPEGGAAPEEITLVLDTTGLGPEVPVPVDLSATRFPDMLPGGSHALVVVGVNPNIIGVVDLATGRFRPVGAGDRAYYVATGHIVFASGGETLSFAPFDVERFEVTGPERPVVSDALRPGGSRPRFTVSASGTLAYARGGYDRELVIVDRYGRESPLGLEQRGYRHPQVSPDGRYVAVTVNPPGRIWMVDLARGSAEPVTSGPSDLLPVWSPDQTQLAFGRRSGEEGPRNMVIPWPAGGEPERLRLATALQEWARSGRLFIGLDTDPGLANISVVDPGSDSVTPWLVTADNERYPRISPDDAWVAYESDATGIYQIYVRSYAGDPPAVPVSNGGGLDAVWSADGTEIFYRTGNTIMAVRVRTTPTFQVVGDPVPLFSGTYDFLNDRNWDVLPDGSFLMVRSNPNIGREIRFLFDWLAPTPSAP